MSGVDGGIPPVATLALDFSAEFWTPSAPIAVQFCSGDRSRATPCPRCLPCLCRTINPRHSFAQYVFKKADDDKGRGGLSCRVACIGCLFRRCPLSGRLSYWHHLPWPIRPKRRPNATRCLTRSNGTKAECSTLKDQRRQSVCRIASRSLWIQT